MLPIYELKDDLKDLSQTIQKANKVNEKFTRVLIAVAILQFIIAFLQLVIPYLIDPERVWVALALEVVVVIVMVVIFKDPKLLKKNKK